MVSDSTRISKFEFAETDIDSITIVRFAYHYDTLPTTHITKPTHRVRKKDTTSVVTIYGVKQEKQKNMEAVQTAQQNTKTDKDSTDNVHLKVLITVVVFFVIMLVLRSRR